MQTALSPPGELLEAISRCGFENRSAVIAAVSGGSDSTALLLLLKSFIDIAATRLVAVTVDHGLRPEAADEALAVGKLAARLGVEHRTLRWSGPKPATGIAAAARAARYRLLAMAAADAGTDIVLTAHTADDQAETVFMRRQRGEGIGLAGMAPVTLFDGKIWIARPLLKIRRETLRGFLRAHSVGWIDDPSNVDRRSERVRIRSELSGSHDTDIEAILELARKNTALREQLGGRAAVLISRFARLVEPGLIHLDPSFLGGGDNEAAVHLLRVLMAVAGGMPHLPDERRTAALASRLSQPPHRATLSRALVASRRDGVWLCRERRGLPEPEPACESMIWDGRFRISAVGSAIQALIAPAGGAAISEIEEDREAPRSLIRVARASRPVFLRRDEQFADVCAAPHPYPLPVKNGEREASTWMPRPSDPRSSRGEGKGEGRRNISKRFAADPTGCWTATPIVSLWHCFLPSFDIGLALAVSALIGAPPIPDSPCAGHNVGQA